MVVILAVILYLGSATLQALQLNHKKVALNPQWLTLIAVGIHGVLLYQWIEQHPGQNLSSSNLFSLMTWLIALLVLVLARFRSVINILIFILPLSALSLISACIFQSPYVLQTGTHPLVLAHIVLSTFAISVIAVAAFQGLLIRMQSYKLKQAQKHVYALDPLQSMVQLLFSISGVGLVTLLLSWITGLQVTELSTLLLLKLILTMVVVALMGYVLIRRKHHAINHSINILWLSFALLIVAYLGTQWITVS